MAGCVTIVDVCACVQVSGLTVSLNQNWYWYNSTVCARTFGHVPDGTPNDDQNSGAYVSSTIGGEAVNTCTCPSLQCGVAWKLASYGALACV